MNRRLVLIALLAILTLAAIARLYALDVYPMGINYDLASNGVFALNILRDGTWPFYVSHMGAPEPLIVYLQAISIALFGVNVFALRVVTALANVGAVAVLFSLTRAFTRDARAALVAALAFAVSMEYIDVAREGLRFTLVPLIETVALFFFWRGWRDGTRRDFILAGVALGVGLYAYIAAVVLPLAILALWMHQFLFERERWRARFADSVLMALVVAVIALPRLVFHLQYPAAALARASQVSLLQNPAVQERGLMYVIGEHLLAQARMFGIEWQGGSFHQPVLDPIVFMFLIAGGVVCFARWKKVEWFWAPLTLGVTLLPDLLGANEPAPNKLRTIGIVAPMFFLVGVGALALFDVFVRWTRSPRLGYLGLGIALSVCVVRGLTPYVTMDAANQPPFWVNEAFNVNLVETTQAGWLLAQPEPVFLPLNEYARAPVRYLLGARVTQVRSALAVDGTLDPRVSVGRASVLYPEDPMRPRTEGRAYSNDPFAFVALIGDTMFVLPPMRTNAASLETELRARATRMAIRDSAGHAVATAYRMEPINDLFQFGLPAPSTATSFAQNIQLVSSALRVDRIQPGESIPLSLFWHASHKLPNDYVIFVHLLDVKENVITAADVIPALGAYPTYLWKPDELVPTHHQINVPARTLPGKYVVEIGLYDALNLNRLDVLDGKGNAIDSRVIIGSVKVGPRDHAKYNPRYLQGANFDNRAALIGYDLQPADAPKFHVSLYWQGLGEIDRDYTLFAHILNADGEIVAQSDHQPQGGSYPTSIWDVGEQVRDDFALEIPNDAPKGRYTIEIGWYELKTGARLSVRDANNQQVGDSIVLGTVLEVNR